MKQYFTSKYWKGQRLLLLTFLLLHVAVAAFVTTSNGITMDEPDYYGYAVRWAHGNVQRDNKMYDSKSPIVAVALLPRIIRQIKEPGYKATDNGLQDVRDGKYLMVIYTIIIAIYLFTWIRRLFGAKAWILPLLFFLFEPTVLSYSMVITSDMASGACMVATLYHLYAFCTRGRIRQFMFFALCLGVSFVCKASLLFLFPALLLLLLFLIYLKIIQWSRKRVIGFAVFSIVISLVVLNAAYFFKGSFRPLSGKIFQSTGFKTLADKPLVNQVPVPLPANYIDALDLLQYHGEIGGGHEESTYLGVYLNGITKYQGTFWNYYLVTGFYKMPISILVLLSLGIVFLFIQRIRRFLQCHIYYIFPFVFFLLVLSFLNPFQIGFRHMLVVYPLLFISLAAVLQLLESHFRFSKMVSWVLLVYMFVSTSLYFPYYMSYTNELLPEKRHVYHVMNDASVDYGQSHHALDRFVEENPTYSVAPTTPRPGKFIVAGSALFDRKSEPDCAWLKQFNPERHVHYSLFVFHISMDDLQQRKLKSPAE